MLNRFNEKTVKSIANADNFIAKKKQANNTALKYKVHNMEREGKIQKYRKYTSNSEKDPLLLLRDLKSQ